MSKTLLLMLIAAFFVSCATNKHTFMRGSVAMKMDETKGIACLESHTVKVGDKLDLYNNDCTSTKGKEGSASCQLVKAGEAKITRLVNDHYSEFETTTPVQFSEGSILSPSK